MNEGDHEVCSYCRAAGIPVGQPCPNCGRAPEWRRLRHAVLELAGAVRGQVERALAAARKPPNG